MPSFSERNGYVRPKNIQIDSLDLETRNLLFNVMKKTFLICNTNQHNYSGMLNKQQEISPLAEDIEFKFHKKPNTNFLITNEIFIDEQYEFIKTEKWYIVFDFIEFFRLLLLLHSDNLQQSNLQNMYNFYDISINLIFEEEKCGYRIVGGKVVPIIHKAEINSIENSMAHGDKFGAVAQHITSALELYAKRPNPDYRNSIKESISAVEAAAKIITGRDKKTLGEALKEIQKLHPSHQLHPALAEGFQKIYGYTNDADGIRHALKDEDTADEADARFMLVSCSAFSNYLISKFGL